MFGKISRNRLIDRNSRMKPTPAIPQPASILGVFQRLAGLFEPFIHFDRFKNASDPSKAKCWVEKPFDDEQGQKPWLTACPDPTAKSNTDRSVVFTVAKIGKACGYVGRLGFLAELHSSANK